MASIAYALCTLTALTCAIMLLNGYRRSHFRLLLWSSICFFGLSVSNALVYVDLVLVRDVDLYGLRQLLGLASLMVLMYGLIWESR